MSDPSEPSLHRADPRLRRWAWWWLLFAALGGTLALGSLQLWLQRGIRGGAQLDVLLLAFIGLSVLVAGGLGALAGALWQQANRVIGENRYPPAEMRTLRDVPIQRGLAARRSARWIRLLAAALAIGAVAMIGYALWVVRQLGG